MDSDDDDDDARSEEGGQAHQDTQLPVHVRARISSLEAAFATLANCDGAIPPELPYAPNYLDAVHRECVRELYGQLSNCNVPRGEQWLRMGANEEAGLHLVCEDEKKRQEYDNNLVLVIDDQGDAEPRVGLVRHQRASKLLLVRQHCKLEDVLGEDHLVVERIRHVVGRGFAPARPCAVLVGFSGDTVTAMMVSHMTRMPRRAVREPDDPEEEGIQGFDVSMLESLCSGRRMQVPWPAVARERVEHLNESQYTAIDALAHNIELIKGPPGTGKSTLIDALVRECVDGESAVCVTAVQNRAVEALAIKFAASKTPFIACGTRACPVTDAWKLEVQVARDARVVEATARLAALQGLRALLRARVARAMAKIYRPLVPTERSARQWARERRARQLVRYPTAELERSVAYKNWKESYPAGRARESNKATQALEDLVDKYMERELDPWRRAAKAIVRARMPEAHAFLDDVTVEVDAAQYRLDKASEEAAAEIARSAKALLCTTATVGVAMRTQRDALGPLLARLRMLICDEAGTLADRHILPVLGAAPVARLILVGDPAQLSCFSNVRNTTPTSTMQRLLNLHMPAAMLTQQYRMPPALCDVVSALFYNGALVTAEGRQAVGVAAPVRYLPVPRGHAEIPDAAGRGTRNGSILNREEVRTVVHEVNRLRGRYPTDDLAVLTTYGAQRAAILEALGDDVATVLTVDSAQGQEFDHVVYNHVATNPQRMGFTKNVNRLCVALSRAKRSLVIVAHPNAVTAVPALKAVRAAAFEDGENVRRLLVAAQRDAALRGVDPGAHTARVCAVCADPISNSVGFLACDPPVARAVVHALCPECAEGHLIARLDSDHFDGRLCCPCKPEAAGGCTAPAYEVASVARVVSAAAFARFNRAVVAQHEMAVARQLEADFEDRVAARVAAVTMGDDDARRADRAIADDVVHIIDTILTLRCPTCNLAFVDFDACALLQCRCGVKFCGFCLHPNATHDHVAECRENPLHGRGEQGVYVAQPEWERAQHQRKQRLVRAHLADATQEHRAAVLEHLRPHGIDIW